jgi:hypothetical protein
LGPSLNRLFSRLPLERTLIFVSLALGLLHAWMGRCAMNPDGINLAEGNPST